MSNKIIKKWSEAKDIQLAIMQTLKEFENRDDLTGWIRADDRVNLSSVTEEIARLSKENNELRQKLTDYNKIQKLRIRAFLSRN